MLYEAYERKILKIKKIIDTISRFKFLILGVSCAILAIVVALLAIKGSVLKDFIPQSQYTYGQEITGFDAKAFLGDVRYEFNGNGYADWSEEKPIYPGEYKVRTVGDGSFNSEKYSKEYSFVIVKKDLNISIEEDVLYGVNPSIEVDNLVFDDKYDSNNFEFEFDYSEQNSTVKIVDGGLTILDAKGNNVSEFYEYGQIFNVDYSFNLIKRPITITFLGENRQYDGTPLKREQYELDGELARGDEINVSEYVSLSTIGSVDNDAKISIINANGADVTNFYQITIEREKLIVEKRPISVTFIGDKKIYDGSALKNEEYLLDGMLAPTDEIRVSEYASITYFGSIDNNAKIEIINSLGQDVTYCYEIEIVKQKLEIEKRALTLRSLSSSRAYNGFELSNEGFIIVEGSKVDGDDIIVRDFTRIINVARVENEHVYQIRQEDKDVSLSYEITEEHGYLEITKKRLDLKAPSLEKMFDGEWAGEGEIAIGPQNVLVDGHRISYELVHEQNGQETEAFFVGEYENKIANIIITDERGKNVTDNYEIVAESGSIVITKRPITFRLIDKEKPFDEKPLTSEEYQVSGEPLLEGHEVSTIVTGSITEIGETVNAFEKVIITLDGEDITENYDVKLINGRLKITKRFISVHPIKYSKSYDGIAISYPAVIDEKHIAYAKWQSDSDERYGAPLYDGCVLYAKVAIEGTLVDVGTCMTSVIEYDIRNQDGVSVIEYYDVITIKGMVAITQREVELSSRDVTKEYDGNPLIASKEDCFISKGTLLDGHVISYTVEGQITSFGEEENRITSVIIYDENGNLVGAAVFGENGVLEWGNYQSMNYKISINNGTLKII